MSSQLLHLVQSFKSKKSTVIDNIIFRLHYRASFYFFAASSVFLYCNRPDQFVVCASTNSLYKEDYLNTYCKLHIGSFYFPNGKINLTQDLMQILRGTELNILQEHVKRWPSSGGDVIPYGWYYPWTSIFCLAHALVFYLPRLIWKSFERKTIKFIINGLDVSDVIKCEGDEISANSKLFISVKRFKNFRSRIFVYKLFACEVLNFVSVLGQFLFVNLIMGGRYLYYGLAAFQLHTPEKPELFPKRATCRTVHFSLGGQVQHHDHICALPLNQLNELIFFMFWYWFSVLTLLSAMVVMYRAVYIVPKIGLIVRVFRIALICRKENFSRMIRLSCKLSATEFFILIQISKNIPMPLFEEYCEVLFKRKSEIKVL